MKVPMSVRKAGALVYDDGHEIVEAESFGAACAEAWSRMQARRLGATDSIGALMEALGENELEELDGAEFTLRKL